MLAFNLIVLCMVIILSYIFKVSQIKKYDPQLMFILLTFTILVLYKTLNYIYNKQNNATAIKAISEQFNNSNTMNEFIADTLTNEQKIKVLEDKLKNYESAFGTNSIVNNNLELQISNLESAISQLGNEYNQDIENSQPAGNAPQISITGSNEDLNVSTNDDDGTPNINYGAVNTDSVAKAIKAFLTHIQSDNGNVEVTV